MQSAYEHSLEGVVFDELVQHEGVFLLVDEVGEDGECRQEGVLFAALFL
jgi:hypothetical protein